ncbi:uncharacterized protein A1O9_09425 [Exophiala aquamarina CBS 119918]|uniref:Uncharacterized protein n=1 Tax=Exophiala aquamarina CBS 119918 TaxID=1182545 RepID=A0A072P2E3_9EURO|nr:uncharacterized protein A1O9_09425 [Exophiala aquamarina CBS 119918]KEF54259.1 hypothetical protein A1O9_09425 [Exophiala aquamarina CBS 119918]
MSGNSSATRIAIIGTGNVGSAIVYALLHRSMNSELLLVDINPSKRDAQICDLRDAACAEGSTTQIRSGTLRDAGSCDIVIIAAGVKKKKGETKVQRLERTNAILQNIIGGLRPFLLPSTIILVVSNPVDVLTTLAYKLAGLPSSQVIGLGTYLDTVRLRRIMGEDLRIFPDCIQANMLGTQDDGPEAEVLAWSTAEVSGVPIAESSLAITGSEWTARLHQEGSDMAHLKGAPVFNIASSVACIVSAIIFDNKPQAGFPGPRFPLGPMPISHYQESLRCSISLPAVLGRSGVTKTVAVEFDDSERKNMVKAGSVVSEIVERLLGDGTEGADE